MATGESAGDRPIHIPQQRVTFERGLVPSHAVTNGTDVEELFVSGGLAFALDLANKRIYWSAWGEIHRSNLDGTAKETLISNLYATVSSIALDLSAGKIYWAQSRESYRKLKSRRQKIEAL